MWNDGLTPPKDDRFVLALVNGERYYIDAEGHEKRCRYEESPMILFFDGKVWRDTDECRVRLKVTRWMDVPYDLR